jgi:hypothetical protein
MIDRLPTISLRTNRDFTSLSYHKPHTEADKLTFPQQTFLYSPITSSVSDNRAMHSSSLPKEGMSSEKRFCDERLDRSQESAHSERD